MDKKRKALGTIDYPHTVGEVPDGQSPVLSVRNLAVSFRTDEGKVRAVRGVSFDLYQGETLCIVGESGSGKSVTSKTIMGILGASAHIDSGSIVYEGEDLTKISEEEFHNIRGTKIGMVFQDPLSSLNPIMKIGKQITEVMIINGDKVRRLKDSITNESLIRWKNDERLLRLLKEERRSGRKEVLSLRKEYRALEEKPGSEEEYLASKGWTEEKVLALDSEFPSKKKALLDKIAEDKKILREKRKEAAIAARKFRAEQRAKHLEKEKALLARFRAWLLGRKPAEDESEEDVLLKGEGGLKGFFHNPLRKAEIAALRKEYGEKISANPSLKRSLLRERRIKELEIRRKYAGKETLGTLYGDFVSERRRYLSDLRVTHGDAKRRALKIMEEVGIAYPEKRFNQYPFEFSGGMRQRIVIAIALTADPDVLICDEPTTALDVTIQAQILELINRLKKARNMSVIFITHDLGVVANMADRVAVMYAGKIVEYGTAEDVFYHPAHPYTWALLSSIPDVDSKERLEAIPGTPPNMLYPPEGDAFALRSKYALGIDFKEEPPMFEISKTHYAATWLLDERAPEAEMPAIVRTRIQNSLKGGNRHE